MKDEQIESLTAKQALAKTIDNSITMDKILRNINSSAENGMNCLRLFDIFLPLGVMKDLLSLGYLISQQNGPVGENIIVINW